VLVIVKTMTFCVLNSSGVNKAESYVVVRFGKWEQIVHRPVD
jgi:hypothetical protein